MLPHRALLLINEYSKPLTRANWRKSNPIVSVRELYLSVYSSWDEVDLHYIIYCNIKLTYWYDIYWCIKIHGVRVCCRKYNITHDDIKKLGIYLVS